MNRIILLVTIAIVTSCKEQNKIEKGKENWIDGTVQTNERIDTIFFHDCYCNLVDDQIILNHVYLGGVHGGRLTTRKTKDSVYFDLRYYPYDFRTFSFEQKSIELNTLSQQLGDTITGTIALVGESKSRDNENYKFNLKGRFKCALKDGSYDYMAFYDDFLRAYSKNEIREKLKQIRQNPDSITELHLDYLYLTEMPTDLRLLKNLSVLYLNENEISNIDIRTLAEIPRLVELHLHGNNISVVSDSISFLTDLAVLDMTGNPMATLPDGVYEMKNLRVLDLGGTKLTGLSKKIKDLTKLERLDIGYTNIIQVPEEIFELPNLVELNLPDTVQLFKFGKVNPTLRKMDATFELLEYNIENLSTLRNLETLTVSFHYTDHEEEYRKHPKDMAMLKRLLPDTGVTEITYLDD